MVESVSRSGSAGPGLSPCEGLPGEQIPPWGWARAQSTAARDEQLEALAKGEEKRGEAARTPGFGVFLPLSAPPVRSGCSRWGAGPGALPGAAPWPGPGPASAALGGPGRADRTGLGTTRSRCREVRGVGPGGPPTPGRDREVPAGGNRGGDGTGSEPRLGWAKLRPEDGLSGV